MSRKPRKSPWRHYLWILRRHAWRIALFVAGVTLATLAVSVRLTPIYESTTTIDIDRQQPTGVLGQEAAQNTTNDADQFLATQIHLIESDSVLRPVVDKFHLRDVEKDALEPAIDQSSTSMQAPVILKNLKITRPPNTYILLIGYRSTNRQLAADVANEIALSYLAHTYRIRYQATAGLSDFMERQIEELRAKMEKSSAALAQFERELNVINPEEKTSILSARLLEINTEFTKAQADRVSKEAAYDSVQSGTLEAAQVSNQGEALKKITENLNDAREKFAEVKRHYGLNHPEYQKAQTRVQELESQTRVHPRLHRPARRNRIPRSRQTRNHALRRRAGNQSRVRPPQRPLLRISNPQARSRRRQETVRRISPQDQGGRHQRRLPELFHPRRGRRQARIETRLPAHLAERPAGIPVRRLRRGRRGGTERRARQHHPRSRPGVASDEHPRHRLAARRKGLAPPPEPPAFRQRNRGPSDGFSKWCKAGSPNGTEAPPSGPSFPQATPGLAGNAANDPALSNYEEAIRTLRNSILLTDFDRRLRSVLLTSASPSEGKSTVAAHLAATHASQHKRTLLIDGDLRRPSVHRLYQVPNSIGLSNVLLQQISWRDAVVRMDEPKGLDILPAGPPTRRASDLVGMGLADLIEEATREYDLVVLDAPPLLGFAEPLQMATAVDGVIVVARAGDTSRKALSTVIGTLHRLRANLVGVVLNEVHREVSAGYYYYYGHYSKYYTKQQDA